MSPEDLRKKIIHVEFLRAFPPAEVSLSHSLIAPENTVKHGTAR
jgi:hypothetical protein